MTSTETPPTEDPRPGGMRTAKSLVVVNTGDGKGKSSAAFGTAMRARARGWPVAVVQFLKSDDWVTGEQLMAEPLGIEFWSLGEGFTWDSDDLARDEAEAREAWRHGKALVEAGEHRLVVFDEITYPLNWGWIDAGEVETTFRDRPDRVSTRADRPRRPPVDDRSGRHGHRDGQDQARLRRPASWPRRASTTDARGADRELGRSVPWFGVVGAVVGAVSGGLYWALSSPPGSSLAAVAAVAAGMAITGGFHEDGLADTADALGGSDRERRLEIMKDPRIGTFGALALVLSLLVRVLALGSLGPLDGLLALVGAHALGRAAATAAMIAFPAAGPDGLGQSYTADLPRAATGAVAALAGAGAASLGLTGAVALSAAVLGGALVAVAARRLFGGTTGDVLGAVEQIGEMAVLVSVVRLVADHGWTWG